MKIGRYLKDYNLYDFSDPTIKLLMFLHFVIIFKML